MPSREEIVEALKSAASVSKIACCDESYCDHLITMGTQVAAMRCEKCKHWHSPEGLRSDYCTGMKWNEIDKMGPDFGCFSHELKEEKK